MRVFITGGAGYIGSKLIEKLLLNDIQVRCYDSLVFGKNSIVSFLDNPNFELVKGDIREYKKIAGYMHDCDVVVHLAAMVFTGGKELTQRINEVNYEATKNITDICKGRNMKFIVASTCSNYGKTTELATEDSELAPTNVYSISKVKAEQYIQKTYPEATILRLSTAFGLSNRMRFDLLINEMTLDAVMKRKVIIYNPEAWRPGLHIDDIAYAIMVCLTRDSAGIYNVGHESMNYQKKKLYDILKNNNVMLAKEEVITDKDPRDYRISFDKFVKKFDFRPRRTIQYGIFEISKALHQGQFENPYDSKYKNLEMYLNGKK